MVSVFCKLYNSTIQLSLVKLYYLSKIYNDIYQLICAIFNSKKMILITDKQHFK